MIKRFQVARTNGKFKISARPDAHSKKTPNRRDSQQILLLSSSFAVLFLQNRIRFEMGIPSERKKSVTWKCQNEADISIWKCLKHFSSKSCLAKNQFYPHDSEKKKKADRAFASAHRRGSSANGRARQEGQSWNSRPDLLSKFFTKTTPRCANTLSLKSLFRLSCEKDFSHHAGIDSNTT